MRLVSYFWCFFLKFLSNFVIRVQQRIPVIRYGGIIWTIVFLFVFLPLSYSETYVGLHFISTHTFAHFHSALANGEQMRKNHLA